MDFSTKIGLQQTQGLRLTQHLIQSIEMLQLSTIELSEKISKELIENPVLEEENTSLCPSTNSEDGDIASVVSMELNGIESVYHRREEKRLSYENLSDNGYSTGFDDDRKRQFIENAVIHEEPLEEHLIWQARLVANDEKEFDLLNRIITYIDERGFLTIDNAKLAKENSISTEEIEKAALIVSNLDPIGCGVQTVQESLIIQSMCLYPDDEIVITILKEYYEEIEKLDYNKISKGLDLSLNIVLEKCTLIHNLDPFPGLQFSAKKTIYIFPDMEVKFIDGEVIIILNDDWIPKIRINPYYSKFLRTKNIDDNSKEYIKKRIQSGKHLIGNIQNRRETITRVVKAIMEHQIEFLKKGTGHLRPLIHTDIAEEVGLHGSTISRVTSNKFIQTSWGIFKLKYFFVSKLRSYNDIEHSSDEIMTLIKDIISNENPLNPYSDEDILKRLQKLNINIARRTISKYRGILDIPSSSIRKKLNFINSREEK